jgi:hypothetical protein
LAHSWPPVSSFLDLALRRSLKTVCSVLQAAPCCRCWRALLRARIRYAIECESQ